MAFNPPLHVCGAPEQWTNDNWLPLTSGCNIESTDTLNQLEQHAIESYRSVADKWRDKLPLGCTKAQYDIDDDEDDEGEEDDEYESGDEAEEADEIDADVGSTMHQGDQQSVETEPILLTLTSETTDSMDESSSRSAPQ